MSRLRLISYMIWIAVDLFVAIALVYIAMHYEPNLLIGLLVLLGSVLFFTLIEYGVHLKLSEGLFKKISSEHMRLHRKPTGEDGMPFFLAMAFISPLYIVSFFLLPFAYACFFAAGVFVGFALYEVLHMVIHNRIMVGRYFQFMVHFHDLHHKQPNKNHGVIFPFWDMLFGTYLPVKK